MNTKTKTLIPNPGLMLLDQRVVERAERRRRIAAAFVWSRIGIRYAGDQKFGDPVPQQEDQAPALTADTPAVAVVEEAVAGEPRHELGGGPGLVDIRALGVTVRESHGRHAKLDADVAVVLSCQAGA